MVKFFFSDTFTKMGGILTNSFIIVIITAANKQEANNIAKCLLEARLIACANIIEAVSSHFHWAGKIDQANEVLIFMKSRQDLFEELCGKVKSIHSYEVPEVIAIPIINSTKDYLDWLNNSLK